jgi:hypothetical protein
MSVRLDPETEELIRRIARQAGRSKSWVVREAVARYAVGPVRRRTPFEALESFIGTGGTGLTDLSERTGERFIHLAGIKAAGRQRPLTRRGKRER